ncbi:MAG TPA: homoserine O-acetyltransferase [Chloroflexi bacterium]|nr:homoserine O-acetyltransferase [Chloroflexota bacterium]HBY47489.1 homoserine O-acetyltransferase [Chloroflexota bacterium]
MTSVTPIDAHTHGASSIIAAPGIAWEPSVAQQTIRIATPADPFVTEAGAELDDVVLSYETWGRLSDAGDNAILVFHALTGDSHAAAHPEIPGDRPGWWEPLIGSGRPIDTDRFFVICANTLASCYGSTGPCTLAPDGARWGIRFPAVTVRDQVNANLRLLDLLGIGRLACAIGGSLGGMEAVELATTAPERVARLVVVAASGRFHAQGIAFNEIQRRSIMLDPSWQGGDYGNQQPAGGIALARMVGMLTFQSDESMTMRFGRHPDARYHAWPEFQGRFDIEGYLQYQGDKLATRFDANAYLYLLRAMDSHDIGRERGGLAEASRRISARTLVIGVRSDVLFPTVHVQATAEAITRGGGAARYWELNSPHGHDAFLKDFHRLDAVLRDGVGQPGTRRVARLAEAVETEAAD